MTLDWIHDRRAPVPCNWTEEAFRALLTAAERADYGREGLAETPARAARAWRELTAGYDQDPREQLRCFDADGYNELVVVREIPFYSLCEHHLLPFHGTASVGYVPDGMILGLSKVARLLEIFARRLQVQERLTSQLADALLGADAGEDEFSCLGVVVIVEAEHLCMTMRGVQKPGTRATTSALRGVLFDKPAARAEALALIQGRHP